MEKVLGSYASAANRPGMPAGCLLVQGALSCGEEATPIKEKLAGRRALIETALRERLERAKKEGELGGESHPADLARYFWSVCCGMSVLATGGATRAELQRVAREAMRAWPGPMS